MFGLILNGGLGQLLAPDPDYALAQQTKNSLNIDDNADNDDKKEDNSDEQTLSAANPTTPPPPTPPPPASSRPPVSPHAANSKASSPYAPPPLSTTPSTSTTPLNPYTPGTPYAPSSPALNPSYFPQTPTGGATTGSGVILSPPPSPWGSPHPATSLASDVLTAAMGTAVSLQSPTSEWDVLKTAFALAAKSTAKSTSKLLKVRPATKRECAPRTTIHLTPLCFPLVVSSASDPRWWIRTPP